MKLKNNVEFEYFYSRVNTNGGIGLPFYFAVDFDGFGATYREKPKVDEDCYGWSTDSTGRYVGIFDLEGKDWKETLVYVDEKGVTHYDV